jgi:diacylglycerol O-acyltransferase/trehalose O-mycolyltransferase
VLKVRIGQRPVTAFARVGAIAAAVTALSLIASSATGVASADPSSLLVDAGSTSDRVTDIVVHSPSMNNDIPLTIIKPKDQSRPRGVIYLLNGAGGGEDNANWLNKSDIEKFTANKNLYVVIPNKGRFSYYTDWQKPDPELGVYKWSTFLGKELPPVIDATFNTNGRNAIGGISSSATSVLNLAIEHKGLYKAVAAYSGCAQTSDAFGQRSIRLVVESRGNGDATNMWGPLDGPAWRANDPVVHADKLRGLKLYLSSGSGLPGRYDNFRYVTDAKTLADQIVVGGVLEGGSLYCTQNLAQRLRTLKIPATVDLEPAGSHSWLYWQSQLHRSWSFYEQALR